MLLGILLVIQIIVCLALIGVVLLQRSEGGALGMGGGPTGFMSARGAGDMLSRTTWILGGVFFALSLTITLVSTQISGGSAIDRLNVESLDPSLLNQAPLPAAPAAGAPADAAPAPGGLDAPAAQIRNPFLEDAAPAGQAAPADPSAPADPAP